MGQAVAMGQAVPMGQAVSMGLPHRSADLRQPEEVHRVHSDEQHPRDHPLPALHHGQHRLFMS